MTFRRWTPDVFPTRCSHNIVQHVGKGQTPYSLSSLLRYHWFLKNGSIPSTITCAPPSWFECCSLSEVNPVFRAAGFVFQAATIFFFIITAGRYLPHSLKYESNLKVDKKGGASLVQRLYGGSNTKQNIIQAKQLICFDSVFYYLNKKDFEEL